MKELKIEKIDTKNVNLAYLTLRVNQDDLIHINVENLQGDNRISVRLEIGVPYAISRLYFDSPNSDMDTEEVKNRVLDWLISREGSEAIENILIRTQD